MRNRVLLRLSEGVFSTELYRYQTLYRPQEIVTLFSIPPQGVRLWNEELIVYDVRFGEGILRHYGFRDRWFEVNLSFDLNGNFVTEHHHGIDWAFNIDICTPYRIVGRDAYSMDLFLDVLAAPDGRSHVVIDEDEFADAIGRGWLSPQEQAGARRGLEELLAIIRGEGLLPYLNRICPMENVMVDVPQPPPVELPLAQVPLLAPERRFLG